MADATHRVKMLVACGGLSKNDLFIQTHADVTGLPIIIPDVTEPVLLGSAMLGACASSEFQTIQVFEVDWHSSVHYPSIQA